jgi:hypothetical protein
MPILDKITVGSRLYNSNMVITLTADLGDGLFTYADGQTPPMVGTIYFEPDMEENPQLIVLD